MTDEQVLGEHPSTKVDRIEVSLLRRNTSCLPSHRAADHLDELPLHRSRDIATLPNHD